MNGWNKDAARDAALPDIAGHIHSEPQGTLDWVGMRNIALPLQVVDGDRIQTVQATVQIYVNLADSHAKGIHMSRLYRALGGAMQATPLTPKSLSRLLKDVLLTHEDTATSAFIDFGFELLLDKPALVSDNSGWNRYPIRLRGELVDHQVKIEQQVVVHYSSTCPASAALARSVIQEKFATDFDAENAVAPAEIEAWLGSSQGIVATPHGQRSAARVQVELNEDLASFPIDQLIAQVEDALGTPVQTAVKREDEQEFALRNGQNPMFCEDAARRLKQCLQAQTEIKDFLILVEHFESLHAHDAVSMVAKGVPNGYRARPN